MGNTQVQSDGRPSLSRELIIETAYELIDEQGAKAFTMRKLGDQLGVSAMACYSYFKSREELLVEVLSHFMETMDTDPVPGERWDDTLRRTMTSIHHEGAAHPNLSLIDADAASSFEALSQHTQKIIRLHLDQGMPEPILRQAWSIIDAYLRGFGANSIAVSTYLSENTTLANEDAPMWISIVASAYTEEAFRNGVEILIQGIRSLAAPDPCEWYTPCEPCEKA